MSRKWKIKLSIPFLLLVFLYSVKGSASSKYGISGYLNIPYAYADSGMCYQHFDDISFFSYSQKMILPNLEVSAKKRKNEDSGILSFKLQLLPESAYTPALAIGILDYNDPSVEKSMYLSASKTIVSLGARLHAGMIKAGKYKDRNLAQSLFEPGNILEHLTSTGTHEENFFIGAEKGVLSFFDLLAGYSSNGVIDAGVRVRLSAMKLEWWQFDVRDKESYKSNQGYTLGWGYRF